MQPKRNKIAPIGLFFLLFISRIVVSVTTMQSMYTGTVGSDIIISLMLSMIAVLVLSLPAIYCIKQKKNPFSVKWVSTLYAVYFVLLAAVNVNRFSYFASTELNPESTSLVYTLLVIVCAVYGALLGIEGITRFSSVAFFLLAIGIVVVLGYNIQGFDEINLYPVISENSDNIFKNMLVSVSSTVEPALFLCLSKRVNATAIKQYVASVLSAFITIILLFYFAVAVLGDYAITQQYPLYSLFEFANVGGFERIDVIHISFWILGIMIKSTLFIYCASVCLSGMKQKNSTFLCGCAVLVLALLFSISNMYATAIYTVYVVLFFVFCALVPLLMLIFGKRNYGDELAQNF